MRYLSACFLCLFLLPLNGLADGRQFKGWCDGGDQLGSEPDLHQAASDTFLGGVCLGFIDGTFQSLNQRDFCGPKDLKRDAVVRLARQFLKDHPDRLGEDESTLLIQAFKAAYPCDPKRGAVRSPLE